MRIVHFLVDGTLSLAITDMTREEYAEMIRLRGGKEIVFRESPITFHPSPYPTGTEKVTQILNAVAAFNNTGETDIALRFIERIAYVAFLAGRTCDHCQKGLHCQSCLLT